MHFDTLLDGTTKNGLCPINQHTYAKSVADYVCRQYQSVKLAKPKEKIIQDTIFLIKWDVKMTSQEVKRNEGAKTKSLQNTWEYENKIKGRN